VASEQGTAEAGTSTAGDGLRLRMHARCSPPPRYARAFVAVSTVRPETTARAPAILATMTVRFGFLVFAAQACGGAASTDSQPPITREPDAAAVDSTDPASVDSTQQDPGYAVLPADACGARSELAYLCSTCISVPVPRCLGNVPQPVKVPAACAKPACEAPLSLLDRSKEVLEGVVCDSVAGLAVRGQCADGKDFVAILGTMSGAITYFKNGIVAGAAAYSRDSAHGSRQPGRR
jgi:hypothetical protein